MKKVFHLIIVTIIVAALAGTGCRKKCPEPTVINESERQVYLVKFEVAFTGGSGQNKIEYTHNDGYIMTEFNQPNNWTYTLARRSGDTVSISGTCFDGTSSYVRILLNDVPWKFSYTNTGSLPFVATADGVLP